MKRLLLVIFCLGIVFINKAQENEFYRFSFTYFTKQLQLSESHKVFYIKVNESWKQVSKSDKPIIEDGSDWKIVDTLNNVVYGAFSEDGVYKKHADPEYSALKNKWLHQYYKPIWEIKMSSLGFDMEYVMNDHAKSWLTDEDIGEVVFDIPEKNAEFPGGIENMYTFISKSVTYPKVGSEGGKVFAQFIIQKNGTISNIEIVRGVHKLLDEEVIRVIEEMPNWIPARQKGKLVNSRYILPVTFHAK